MFEDPIKQLYQFPNDSVTNFHKLTYLKLYKLSYNCGDQSLK